LAVVAGMKKPIDHRGPTKVERIKKIKKIINELRYQYSWTFLLMCDK